MDELSKSEQSGPSDIGAANVPEVDLQLSVIHATRTWVQYGVFGFAVFCILIGAVEALFGR